jgi:hypothetical protein
VTTHCWLALLPEQGGDVAAALSGDAGWLCAWRSAAKPVRSALRVDPRLIDASGPAATVSLVWPPREFSLPFDDPTVQQARRTLLAGPAFDAVSTLMRDSSSYAGSVLVARGDDAGLRLRDDPFARVHPARILDVGAGLLAARVPWPVGPVIERYGSAQPWPLDRFVA